MVYPSSSSLPPTLYLLFSTGNGNLTFVTDDQPAFSDMALQWIAEGCEIVGGCCRTTPEDISEIFLKTRGINKKRD